MRVGPEETRPGREGSLYLKRFVAVVALAGGALLQAEADPEAPSPVVLELFTAQGCSSCPPADRVLSTLGRDEATRARVVPLAFHVDYWNQIGWTDPFGSPRWSARQETYGRLFGLESVYTPQLVVNGRTQLNGAQEPRAREAIAGELERPSLARVGLEATLAEGSPLATINVRAEILERAGAGKLDLLVALFENDVVTSVARGENRGRVLHNDFIVRRLETALSLEARRGASGQKALSLRLDPGWRRENLGVAAFLQDPRSMKIHGAASKLLR